MSVCQSPILMRSTSRKPCQACAEIIRLASPDNKPDRIAQPPGLRWDPRSLANRVRGRKRILLTITSNLRVIILRWLYPDPQRHRT